MKKHLLILLILLCTFSAFGQNKVSYAWARKTDTAYTPGSWLLDSVMRAKYYASADSNKVLGVDAQGYFVLRTKSNAATVDSSLYATVTRLADTSTVLRSLIGTGGLDTTSLSNRIDARVKYTDTAAMLTPYALLTEIPSITGKVNYTDTAAMLSPYLRKADTSTLSARINLKQNYTDTLTWDATKKNLADTAAVLRGLIPTGTDTTSLSNRIDARVKYTDTASMLSPYALTSELTNQSGAAGTLQNLHITGTNGSGYLLLRHQASDAVASGQTSVVFADANGDLKWKNDNKFYTTLRDFKNTADRVYSFQNKDYTLADSAVVAAKVSYVDTSAMLGGYLRKVDTSTLSNRINLKANTASPTFTGTVTIPTGANITTPNILGLTSGSTNDSLVVADPSTGALKRISSSRIGGGGGGGADANAWHITGDTATVNKVFGTTSTISSHRIDFKVGNEVVGYMGWTTGGFRYGTFMSRGSTAFNYDALCLGGEAHISTGIRSVTIGGVGTKALGTNAIGMGGGAAESNDSWAWGSQNTYANGTNSVAFGSYANSNNFTGCFNFSDFSETSFSSNTANNQFMAKYANGFIFKTAAATVRFQVKSNGIINIANCPAYADNAAAISAGLVVGDLYYRTGHGLDIVR